MFPLELVNSHKWFHSLTSPFEVQLGCESKGHVRS